MTNNQLVEIPIEDWSKLRDLYNNRRRESVSYNLLQTFIDWKEKCPSIDFFKIYSLNGDWSDGTFIIQDDTPSIMFNTQNTSLDRPITALNCIDKKTELLFVAIPARNRPILDQYFTHNQYVPEPGAIVPTIWYYISQKDALNFNTDPPEGITLATLRHDHVDTINNIWPHRYPGSENFISRLITYNVNVGVFDSEGTLLAWCLRLPIGSLGVLHVRDDQKRKGYGSLMVRVMAKKIAELGIEVTAPVVEMNAPSRAMFEKLGFREIDRVYWAIRPALI